MTAACLDERRCDLDLLRIAAFGLLILHHLNTVFVKWDFHIKTAHPAKWVEVRMLLFAVVSRFGFAAGHLVSVTWP